MGCWFTPAILFLRGRGFKAMPINSNQKGKRGERALANELKEYGFEARRGVQYQGGHGSDDVICTEVNDADFDIECKCVEKLNIHKAMDKMMEDCAPGQSPVVMHKKNGTGWLATIELSDFVALVQNRNTLRAEMGG